MILSSSITVAQDIPELKFTPNGFEPIVIEIDKPASELYEKALNWVQETYQNPKEVLMADIPNEKIRVTGLARNAWVQKVMISNFLHDLKYSMEISFKDGKYRVEYVFISLIPHEPTHFPQTSTSAFFNKKGQPRSHYKTAIPSMEEKANSLNQSLYNYLSGLTTKVDKDW